MCAAQAPTFVFHEATQCRWTGTVTQLMPPDYGIVDGVAFYHADVVVGPKPARVGETVHCDGVLNTDGGKYQWRCICIRVERGGLSATPGVRDGPGRQFATAVIISCAVPHTMLRQCMYTYIAVALYSCG
jgi:hypothetical protein